MILVTGATGFIGRRLSRALLDRGESVRALARSQSLAGMARVEGLEPWSADVTNAAGLRSAAEGCWAVIHLAALRARFASDLAHFDRVNVGGTHNVLEAALGAGASKVLHVSTYLVLGPSDGAPKTEADRAPLSRFSSPYQRTKYFADLETDRFLERGLPVVTLYPTTCFGRSLRRGESPVTDLARAFIRGWPLPVVGRGDRLRNLVWVDDVVDGLLRALDLASAGDRFILGGDNVTTMQLLETLASLVGRGVRAFHVPVPAARAIGSACEALAAISGRDWPLTRSTIDILCAEWAVSSEKAERILGYHRTPLREGLRQTLGIPAD